MSFIKYDKGQVLRRLMFFFLCVVQFSVRAQVDTGGNGTTSDHNKQIIGYVTQWDAWKASSAGLPSAGALTQLNIDYSKYTILNYSFLGVANDGSLHSGDFRNKSIYMEGVEQQPADIFDTDVYSSWDLYILFGELDLVQYISSSVVERAEAQGFEVEEGGTTWSNPAWGLYDKALPLPLHTENGALGLLDLAHQNGVKVMASIGGWSMCKHFPEMAADPEKRARFIEDCKTLMAVGFDGIDLDWEYPGYGGMNFTGTNADFTNFTTLVQEIRDAIGSDKLITAAMSADPDKLDGFEWNKLVQIMDYFNMMTYDFNGGWSDSAGHNSPVYAYDGAEEPAFNWQSTMDKLNSLGVPSGMINMGCPFYGRGVVCQDEAGLNAATQKANVTVQPDGPISTCADYTNWPLDVYDGTPTYFYIVQKTGLGTTNGWTRHWDDQAKVPYLTKGNYFLSYDDEESIGIKAQYILDNKLAGAIVWTGYGDLEISGTATSFGTKLKRWSNVSSDLVNKLNEVFATGDTGDPDDPGDGDDTTGNTLRIVGYIPSYQGAASDIQYDKLTNLIYAFVTPGSSGDGSLDAIPNASKLEEIVTMAHANQVKVSIAVGGWTDLNNPGFEGLSSTASGRENFAGALLDICNQYDLDGVDIDWEYPIDQTDDYTQMMQVLSEKLHANNKVLSAAVPGGSYYGQYVNIDALNSLDFLNIMAYDGDSGAGHSPYSYAVSALEYWTGKGLENSKAVLGVPFYSRPSWTTYADLLAAGASPDEDYYNGEYYNGIPTIQQKSELAKSYGGIMIWEVSQDATGEYSLLSAIYDVIKGSDVTALSADANGPYVGIVGAAIGFGGSASGGTTPYTYSWNFGDGSVGSGSNPTHIYTATGSYSAVLTVTDSDGNTATSSATVTVTDDDSDSSCWPDWTAGAYSGGAQVSYNGINYQAKWWTDGVPGEDEAWENMGVCDGSGDTGSDSCWPDWTAGAYSGGTQVSYNGVNYQAKWWTDGVPGEDETWENMGVCDGSGDAGGDDCWPDWIEGAYSGGAQVSYNGINYQAKWWTDGEPGTDDVWEAMGTCGEVVSGSLSVSAGSSYSSNVNDVITFSATVTGGTTPYAYRWDFGDDSEGSGSDPEHTYTAGGDYVVTLTVTDADGTTASDNVNVAISDQAVTIPAAPDNLTASSESSSKIIISWTDNADNESAFIILYSTDGSSWYDLAEVDANTTSYSDTGLASSTTYYYKVATQNSAGTSEYSNVASATTLESQGSTADLPTRIMSGYWHTWGGGVPFIKLGEVDSHWDVINIAFAEPVSPGSTDGQMKFEITGLSGDYSIDDFKADIKELQSRGKKIVLSVGGYEGYFSLGSSSAVTTFTNAIKGYIDEYGFDGIDIDLEQYSVEFNSGADPDFENPVSPKVVNLIQALKNITNAYGDDFILSFAPETFYFQMAHTYYGGLNSYVDTRSGVYIPVIHALRDKITYVQAQLYNSVAIKGLDGVYYDMGTTAGIVAMCKMAIEGFTLNGNDSYYFPGLRPDQVVIGVPASQGAAGSGQISDAGLQNAFNTLVQSYPDLRGFMAWSVNWDAYQNSNSFAINNRTFLDGLKNVSTQADFMKTNESVSTELKVYPNPVTNTLNIEGADEGAVFEIFNTMGQKVLMTTDCPVDVSGLKPGTYIIKVSSDQITGKSVFIKN